jgi:DNA-binding transcriptional regulator YbjK
LNPIEDTNQTTMQQYRQDVVYQTLSANDTLKKHYDYYNKSTTRTQSPILSINQLVRPQSIVNMKKEAVTAVTLTKIILLFVLLLICLLIR